MSCAASLFCCTLRNFSSACYECTVKQVAVHEGPRLNAGFGNRRVLRTATWRDEQGLGRAWAAVLRMLLS